MSVVLKYYGKRGEILKKTLIVSIIIVILVLIFACSDSSSSSSNSKCTICGKNATHTFQGYGYCNKHYQNAVKWAIDNVAERDN